MGIELDPQFAQLMVALAERYPNVRLREGTILAYATDLADLTLDQVRAGMMAATKECEFFPTVAAIRRFVKPGVEDAALLSWAAFQHAASSIGSYATLVVDDPAAGEALVAVFGSWPSYCEADGPTVGARRLEYLAAYREARRRQVTHARPMRLAGLCQTAPLPGTWIGHITARGQVQAVPGQTLLESGDGHAERLALREAGAQEEAEGKGEA